MKKQKEEQGRRGMPAFLAWILAFLVAAGAMVYQRLTGPTYPLRGSVRVGETEVSYKLPRKGLSPKGGEERIEVSLPAAGLDREPVLHYRRHPTREEFTAVTMERREEEGKEARYTAGLPAQPAAGKLAYHITIGDTVRIPPAEASQVILRCKDPVDPAFWIPHVVLVILAMVFGARAALAALAGSPVLGRWSWLTLLAMTGGVAIFGPLVQKQAFGSYWTGWPLGGDWTDNKAALMWLAWLFCCLVLLKFQGRARTLRRLAVILAALVMLAAFAIPHSLFGSELDYTRLEQGVDPAEAVRTGR